MLLNHNQKYFISPEGNSGKIGFQFDHFAVKSPFLSGGNIIFLRTHYVWPLRGDSSIDKGEEQQNKVAAVHTRHTSRSGLN